MNLFSQYRILTRGPFEYRVESRDWVTPISWTWRGECECTSLGAAHEAIGKLKARARIKSPEWEVIEYD